jgi:hypothetical protein
MTRLHAKFLLMGLSAAAALAATSSPSQAGGLFHGLFGYSHYYDGCCGTGYYGYPAYSSYYGPVDYGYSYYPPADYAFSGPDVYAPSSCCAPATGIADPCCGTPGTTGDCQLGSPGWKPPAQGPAAPGGAAPRTFEDEKPGETEKLPPSQEGFGPREPGSPTKPEGDAFNTETFRVPTPQTPASDVPQKQPAPTPSAVDEGSKSSESASPAAPAEAATPAEATTPAKPAESAAPAAGTPAEETPQPKVETESDDSLRVRVLDLDQKVTYTSASGHRRSAIRATFSSPVVVRGPIGPNREWVAVPKLVRK